MQNGVYPIAKSRDNMTKEIVQRYIEGHNFTEITRNCNVRPPTIGEEQEVVSEHSSFSGRSEVSTATPRRMDVDLGYEPEGSDSPSYERWKISLHNMLEDSEGVRLFKNFLGESNNEKILECWLAMKGFQDFGLSKNSGKSANSSAASSTTGPLTAMDEETIDKRFKLANTIYKTYLEGSGEKSLSAVIKEATKKYIRVQIRAAKRQRDKTLDRDLFVQAQTEIEFNVEAHSYKLFLASSCFQQYAAQCDGASAKLSSQPAQGSTRENQTKPSYEAQASHPNPGYLPPLDENKIWELPPSTRDRAERGAKASVSKAGPGANVNAGGHNSFTPALHNSNQLNVPRSAAAPYFTPNTYVVPPGSVIGSDQASKSSDATSDFSSIDSSIDIYPPTRTGHKRMMHRQMKKNYAANVLPECNHVPRTSLCQKISTQATDEPRAFFEQLRQRLEQVIEERARAAAAVQQQIEEEDAILESHLNRVMESPRGQNSPPLRRRPPPLMMTSSTSWGDAPASFQPPKPVASQFQAMASKASVTSSGFQPVTKQFPTASKQHEFATLRKEVPGVRKLGRKDSSAPPAADAASINLGIVPGIPNNEVPDVPTPVQPVDKTQMISAWIQTPSSQFPNRTSKRSNVRHRNPSTGTSSSPSSSSNQDIDAPAQHFVNPISSTGLTLTSHAAYPLQPLAQDPTMPILEQPDVSTTIEEVKRRLIEETDGLYDALPDFLSSAANAPSQGAAGKPEVMESDSDSSTETATFANVGGGGGAEQTTVYYYMPNEPVAYKVRLPHRPLTLGQFKASLPTARRNFKYFFKQKSSELNGRAVYFELARDHEPLPLYDDNVLAKLELVPNDNS